MYGNTGAHGMTGKRPRYTRLNIETDKAIQAEAEKQNRSVANMIEIACIEYVERLKETPIWCNKTKCKFHDKGVCILIEGECPDDKS